MLDLSKTIEVIEKQFWDVHPETAKAIPSEILPEILDALAEQANVEMEAAYKELRALPDGDPGMFRALHDAQDLLTVLDYLRAKAEEARA